MSQLKLMEFLYLFIIIPFKQVGFIKVCFKLFLC
jgi:hypothetical protein